MTGTLLKTKLYMPPRRPNLVARPRLVGVLEQGLRLRHKLTLVSAPAGFGKTTLVGEWAAGCGRPAAWVSLDEGDGDLTRFLSYLVAAIRSVAPTVGEGLLNVLQSPQPPPRDAVLTALINEISAVPDEFVLVLDDYHVVESQAVDEALAFLIGHAPPQMHLVITTREDPQLPLARLRARWQMTELRAADLRFSPAEAATFLNQTMGFTLAEADVAALESRTEGWIAGLQLAALSMRGERDVHSFVESFTGSHQFVLDYLVEEVLHRQPDNVQTFLLHTSILDRLCGSLCDAVLASTDMAGQEMLAYLQRANLFVVSLDNERRWFRYHHLFGDLLRQRLQQRAAPVGEEGLGVEALHIRASEWYEAHGLVLEAFQHAAAGNDVARAARLVEGEGMPLHYQGAVAPVLKWLAGLPPSVLDATPALWVTYASALSVAGQNTQVEDKLAAAEAALQEAEKNDETRDLIGRIATIRARLAAPQYDVDTVIAESRRALEFLDPENLAVRTAAAWTLAVGYLFQGDRTAAREAYADTIRMCEATGNTFFNILATTGLGLVQEAENQLHEAAASYRRVLELAGEPPLPAACEAHLGLARTAYQWNELEAAQRHAAWGTKLARQIENIDGTVAADVLLARLKFAKQDLDGAAVLLAEAEQAARRHSFVAQIPAIAGAQVVVLLRQGHVAGAARVVGTHDLPLSQARVLLARGDPAGALVAAEKARAAAEAQDWADERLKALMLEAVALEAADDRERALQRLSAALALAEPGGFIRLFVDEGRPVARLLAEAAARGMMPAYTSKLLDAFAVEAGADAPRPASSMPPAQPLVEPLSERELEVLRLVAQGLSNRQIAERLFLALSTVKGHNRRIYEKLQVRRRTEAVARARALGLL